MATGLTASVPGNRAAKTINRARALDTTRPPRTVATVPTASAPTKPREGSSARHPRARVGTNLTVNAKTGNRARARPTQPGRRARVRDRPYRERTQRLESRARAALTQPGRRARVGTGLTASAKTINRARVVPIQPDLPVQEVTNHRRLVISATAAGSPAIQKLAAATKGGGITAREPQGKTAALRAKTQAAVTAVIPTQASAGEN